MSDRIVPVAFESDFEPISSAADALDRTSATVYDTKSRVFFTTRTCVGE